MVTRICLNVTFYAHLLCCEFCCKNFTRPEGINELWRNTHKILWVCVCIFVFVIRHAILYGALYFQQWPVRLYHTLLFGASLCDESTQKGNNRHSHLFCMLDSWRLSLKRNHHETNEREKNCVSSVKLFCIIHVHDWNLIMSAEGVMIS